MLHHGYRLASKRFRINEEKENPLLFMDFVSVVNFSQEIINFSIRITSNDDVKYNDSVSWKSE